MAIEEAGDDALEQLAEIRRARQRLDEQEMGAVRAARRAGRSWAEIATMLGITRQSAWERWNELDPAAAPADIAVADVLAETAAGVAAAGSSAASTSRRRANVKVPELTGMIFEQAAARLARVGLRGLPTELDPALRDELPSLLVRAQAPEAGARLGPGSPVRLWLRSDGEGGAGVREPRRPNPRSDAGRMMRLIEDAG